MWQEQRSTRRPKEGWNHAAFPLDRRGGRPGGRKVEGGHDGHRGCAHRGAPDVHGHSGRDGLGHSTRRPGRGHRGTARPVPLPPSRVGQLATAGIDRATDGWCQGKGQQESTPLAPPPALAADYLWNPELAGRPNGEDHLDHGAINACGLLRAADFIHMALSATPGDPGFGRDSNSMAETDGRGGYTGTEDIRLPSPAALPPSWQLGPV